MTSPENAAETPGSEAAVMRPRRSRRRRIASLGVLVAALGTVGTLYAGFAPAASSASNNDPAIQRGRALFLQGCATCHGLNGEGGAIAPSLIGAGASAVDFQMSTGRMPLQQEGAEAPQKRPDPRFNAQDIQDIAAYVASLGAGPAEPTNLNYQSADVAYGGALFRTNCAQCHNFAGSGGALTYGKYAPSLSDATPKQIYEAMITGPENMPVFGDKQITPSQKLAIINYVETIKAEPNPGGAGLGRVGPVTETAVAWLVGIGGLVIITMWIGSKV
ncbi:MAG TPA: c-type cytochrome [Mycobacteriales bacterium]|nr:c-type cytochrome [Mycobacteriales bacterium]